MEKRRIASSLSTKKGTLDDDYFLFDNGEVLHQYDNNPYPCQFNLSATLSIAQISDSVKDDFLKSASAEDLELVKSILNS